MAATTMYVTPAGAGAKDGAAWASAMGEAEFETDLEGGSEAGDIYYVLAGTYTMDSSYDSSARAGTTVAPISIIGVKAATTAEPPTVSDWPAVGSSDRPLFNCGATNGFSTGNFYKIYNIIVTINAATGLNTGGGSVVFNVKSTNSSATANRYALYGTGTKFIQCEAISTNGRAIYSSNTTFIGCYIHDSNEGIFMGADNLTLLHSIIDTCVTGITAASYDYLLLVNNTIYNSTTAVSATDSVRNVFINNIIDTATDGFLWTTQENINFFAYNHVGNSVTDMWDMVEETDAAYRDNWVTSGDPKFNGAAGGNFSLASDSPCIDAGMAMLLGVG